jgi:hypothetical protein
VRTVGSEAVALLCSTTMPVALSAHPKVPLQASSRSWKNESPWLLTRTTP